MWLLFRSGTIRLGIVSRILSWIFKGMVLLRKWRVISVFYCLVLSYWFVVFGCILFSLLFLQLKFLKDSLEKTLLSMSFYYCFSLIHCVCSALKQCGDYVKTSRPPFFGVKYTWSVCRNLAGGFFSTDVFWKLWLFFYAIN